ANFDVYANNQGTWYIARRCIPRVGGTAEDNNSSVGPGYIYRVDYAGKEVVTPEQPNRPQTGLGAFAADTYRVENGIGAAWSNLCIGETNPIGYGQGRGVSDTGDTWVNGGTLNHTDTGYLWSHYN